MRLTSELWVAGYLRRVAAEGRQAVLVKRGAREAGAIHIRIVCAGDRNRLLSPAPMSLDPDAGSGRRWSQRADGPASEIDRILDGELRFDEDAWIVDVDDRDGADCLLDEERAQDAD